MELHAPFVLELSSRTKLGDVKTMVAAKLQMGIPAANFTIKGTPKNLALKSERTLAYFNIPDAVTLTYSIK